jgi:predicted ATPase
VAAVSALFQKGGVRLVTLTGPGGVGKTALALGVAASLGDHFADGAVFVPLAALRQPDLVAPTIARVLGMVDSGRRSPIDRLGALLRDRHLLLVLDNLEHLLDAAPVATDLLVRCPRLAVLATSRSILRLAGEHVMPVPPLAVPDPDHLLATDELTTFGAVRLFVERARASNPAFNLTVENAGAVAAICHRLDGLPLAIELAAARSAVLSPASLLPLLARRLPLLTAGRRDAPARQRTLADAIAWSDDLLSPADRALFRRVAVCVGGFTLKMAEALAAATGIPGPDALAGITALVDHSLLRHESGPGGVSRYLMLETVREFGLQRLTEANEEEVTRNAHAACCARLDGWLEPNHLEPGERLDDRLMQIEAEHPNLLQALDWMAQTGEAAGVLRLAGALAVFWHQRGYLKEGQRWLEWALERAPDEATLWRGRALAGLGLVVWPQGDLDRAASLAESALDIAQQIGDLELTALSFHLLALAEGSRRRYERAERLMEEALSRWRAFGSPTNEAMALANLSGYVILGRDDVETGTRLGEEALVQFHATGHASGTAMVLRMLAGLAARQGNDRQAVAAYQEAVALWAGIGERWAIAWAFCGIAALAAEHGQPEHAATLLGAIDACLSVTGGDLPHEGDRRRYELAETTARAALGEERFAHLRAAGQQLPLREAVVVAGQVTVPIA